MGRVEASCQNIDVAQIFQIARFESSQRCVPFSDRCVPADEPTFDAMLLRKDLNHVLGVLEAGGEDQAGISVYRVFHDFASSGANKRILIHQGFDFVADELTATNMES